MLEVFENALAAKAVDATGGQVFSARRKCGEHGDHGAEAVGYDRSYTT
jgi:hypothetical protein